MELLQQYNKIKYTLSVQMPNKNKIKIAKIRTNSYNFWVHLIFMDLQNYNTIK